MKTKAKTCFLLVFALIVAAVFATILCMQVKNDPAYADEIPPEQPEQTVQATNFVLSTEAEIVAAEYEFSKMNETECRVRITNKTVATKAVIPSYVEIDGKRYAVTEIANNGFMSSPNLTRVSLPTTIKKIGINAFYNCAKLNRVNLARVQEIGSSAFYKCPELTELIIPLSVKKIGANILRNNNTLVKVRANSDGEAWVATWNNGNNGSVQYGSTDTHPLELRPIYDTVARSATPVAYALSDGQPRNDEFYEPITIDTENRDEYMEKEGDIIYIPAKYNGINIERIDDYAFGDETSFDKFIVEYSELPLAIGTGAFSGTFGESIIINRQITYYDERNDIYANSIFIDSHVKKIALPNNITSLPEAMFVGCVDLTNIYFIQPEEKTREQAKQIIESQSDGFGIVTIPTYIKIVGANAFDGTISIKELHLFDSINKIENDVIVSWNNNTQKVFIHNTKKIEGWDPNWNGSFTNIEYDREFHTITFDPNGGSFVGVTDETVIGDGVKGEKIGNIFPAVKKIGYECEGWFIDKEDDEVKYEAETVYSFDRDIVLYARWTLRTYDIYFEAQGGTGGVSSVELHYGDPFPTVEAPTMTGSVFQGYYEHPNGVGIKYYDEKMQSMYSWEFEETVTEITLYAFWQKIEYRIDLHSGYGSNDVLHTITPVYYNESIPNVDIQPPSRAHYIFAGYYDGMKGAGEKYYNADMSRIVQIWSKAENGNLYAYWIPIEYTITYDLAGGANKGDNPETYTVESSFNLKNATHATLFFDGWTYNGKKITSVSGMPGGGITLVATWTDVEKIYVTQALGSVIDIDISNPKVSIAFCMSELAFYPFDRFTFNINVAASVNELTIYGNGYSYTMAVTAVSRQTDLKLYLDNITMTAPKGKRTIDIDTKKNLYLYYTSNVTINGYSPTAFGYDGETAIRCYGLIIDTIGTGTRQLTVRGGAGSVGVPYTGMPTIGEVGSRDGGNGAAAIVANTVKILCSYVTILGGNGGDGGSSWASGGSKGYAGYGGFAIRMVGSSPKLTLSDGITNVNVNFGIDGIDGIGAEPSYPRPLDPKLPGPITPTIDPTDPDMPLV